MTFYPPEAKIPVSLLTDEFFLEPLAPKHVALDHAALMASKEMLRVWGGHEWPTDNFSVDQNLLDMRMHHKEHVQRVAFTYTVLDPIGSQCLGCVYIRDLAELGAYQIDHPALSAVPDYHAHLRFWVAAPYLEKDYEELLLSVLQDWFAAEWAFEKVLVHSRSVDKRQINLFTRMQLPYSFSLGYPGRGGEHQFFELFASAT